MPFALKETLAAACAGRPLGAAEALAAMGDFPSNIRTLLAAALAASAAHKGNKFFTCAIINAKSGRCAENCAFCAQSSYHNTHSPVYPLISQEKIYERARILAANNVSRMGIVTSGAGPGAADLDRLYETARKISAELPIKLCASLGLLSGDMAASLRQAGFTSYHHNLETARGFYPRICTSHDYELRVETVRLAARAGLRVCSGGLFGLGETWEQRVQLAQTLGELEADSIPINFLMPIPGTPLEGRKQTGPMEGLAVLALFRLMHPRKDLVLCGGRGATLGEWDRLAFMGLANGVMVGDYLTAKGNPFARDMGVINEIGGING